MISGVILFLLIVCGGIFLFFKHAKITKKIDAVADSTDYFQLQLEESAEQIISKLRNHVEHLEYLIQEADEKIFALDQRLKRFDTLNRIQMDVEKNVITEEAIENSSALEEKVEMNISEINQQVYDLISQGIDTNEIAKRTGIGKGAVLLISQMHKKK